jgi:DNA-binding transcriptional MerR regulator
MKVETDRMLSIGRFARTTGLTVKALRHYDELGLLRPAHVDSWTGYRWYERAQVRDAVAVRRLRTLRLPLDKVAALLRSDEVSLREVLAVHRARLEGELVETRQRSCPSSIA